MRIFLVIDAEKRRALDDRFRQLKEQEVKLTSYMERAENTYIKRHLKPELLLDLSLGDSGDSYEQQVEALRKEYRTTKDAADLHGIIDQKKEDLRRSLERDTDRTLADEKQRGISRDEFFRAPERSVSPAFKRAVHRDR